MDPCYAKKRGDDNETRTLLLERLTQWARSESAIVFGFERNLTDSGVFEKYEKG